MPRIEREIAMGQLNRLLDELPELTWEAAKKAMYPTILHFSAAIPQEPPAPLPDQKYRRTMRLIQALTETVKPFDTAVVGEVGIKVPYAPWVVGPDYPGEKLGGGIQYQARIHEGRWWQLDDIFENNVDGAWILFADEFWKEFIKEVKDWRG